MRSALPTSGPHTPTRHPARRPARGRGVGVLVTVLLAGAVATTGTTPAAAAALTTTTVATTTLAAAPVTDSFGRSVTGGWGTAERGGTWRTSGSTLHSVAPGVARQRVPQPGATAAVHLDGYSTTDTDLTVDVALDKKPTGGGTYVSVVGRRVGTTGDYRARLKIQSTGAVTLIAARGETSLKSVTVPGLTYAAGTTLSVRVQVTGTSPSTIRAKAWKAGTTEPTTWQVQATDSTAALQAPGGVAAATYVSGSATNAPVVATFTRVAARPTATPVNVAPVAAMTSRVADLTASLDGSGSTDVDGRVTSHSWTFGDGATGAGPSATHTYAAAGTYTVTLAVTDDAGARGTTTSTVTVTKPNTAPVARLAALTDGLVASLDGSGSTDVDGRVASHTWTFGDGTTGTGPTVRHTYPKAGTYTVTLAVTDDRGARSTTSKAVTVASTEAPGASNTGVPAGTALRVHTGDLVVTTPGAVIDALDIHGLVIIKAPDVTITRSIIRGRPVTSSTALITNNLGAYRFTLTDSELAAAHPSPHINGITGANFTVRRTNIHRVIDQIHITGDNVTVEDSWLHDNLHYTVDPYHSDGSHDDNVQVQGGRNIRLVGNTMTGSYNAALQITQDRAPVADLTYTHNRVDHGGCTLNIAEKTRGPMTGLVITDNTFGTASRHNCHVIHPPTSPITFARNTTTNGTALKMVKR